MKREDGEHCDSCGGLYRTVWWCGDRDNDDGELWAKIYHQAVGKQNISEGGLLCPVCADEAGRELNITLRWQVMPYWVRDTEPVQAREFLAKVEDRVRELEKERAKIVERGLWLRERANDDIYSVSYRQALAAAGRNILEDLGEPVPEVKI